MPASDRTLRAAYGKAHQKRRAYLLQLLPYPCNVCGETMWPHEARALDLDHTIPVVNGGVAGEGELAHRRCNRSRGGHLAASRAKATRDAPTPTDVTERRTLPRGRATTKTEAPRSFVDGRQDPAIHFSGARATDPDVLERQNAVFSQAWMKHLEDVPANACMPRIMSGPHPDAVGSYGEDLVAEARDRYGWVLDWWQQVAVGRILEHDAAGALVWLRVLASTSRQIGKSYLTRAVSLFRIIHPELFGGVEQLVLSSATTMKLASEVQRPAKEWAAARGWKVYASSAYAGIHHPDGSRWLTAPVTSTHGYTVNLGVLDEAWGLSAAAVRDHIEPTQLRAACPQLLVTSTAHQDATAYVLDMRSEAVADLDDVADLLIVEWSIPEDVTDMEDRDLWRMASPVWTRQRERMLEQKLAKDPLTFVTQYLNRWPKPRTAEDADLLVDPELLSASAGRGPMGYMDPVLVVEDAFGTSACVAIAEQDTDGVVRVTGMVTETREQAWNYADAFLADPHLVGGRVLVGASLVIDPRCDQLLVTPEPRGGMEVRRALPLFRTLLRERRLVVDDDAPDLVHQLLTARTTKTTSGVTLAHRWQRVDLARAAIWAVAEAAQPGGGPVYMGNETGTR